MEVIIVYILIGIMGATVLGTFIFILYLNIKNDREEMKNQSVEKL